MLSREEFEKLQNLLTKRQNVIDSYKKCIDKRNSSIKQACKETAEKIIKHLLNFIENETFHVGYELDKAERELYKLAKQFSVEIKED